MASTRATVWRALRRARRQRRCAPSRPSAAAAAAVATTATGARRWRAARRGTSRLHLPLPPPPPRARRGLVRRGGCGLRSEGAPESRDPPLETPPRCVTITAQSRFRVHVATCSPSRCSLLAASDPLSRSLSGGVSPCSNLTEDLRGWNLKVKLVMCSNCLHGALALHNTSRISREATVAPNAYPTCLAATRGGSSSRPRPPTR